MKRIFIVVLLALAAAGVAMGQANGNKSSKQGKVSDEETIIGLEKQAWEAWKNRNGAFFQAFLADDAILVGASGVENKADSIKNITSSMCEVKSYSLDNFKLRMLDKNTAILTYSAKQDLTCQGKAGPTGIWASSLFVRRSGKWMNLTHQETPTDPGM